MLEALDALISQNEKDAQSLFLRGRARKFHLSLSLPCAEYDDLVLEYLGDMVAAVQLEPQNDEFVARLAKEKLEYTLELESHCMSVGESLEGDSLAAKSVALSWQHTHEIARSALAIKDIRDENKLLALSALSHALLASSQMPECASAITKWIQVASSNNAELADALTFRGQYEEANGDLQSALDTWSLALQKQPNNLNALVHRAAALRSVGMSAEAIEIWDRLIELNPDNADFPYRAAADYELCDQHAQSINSLKKCLKIQPKHLFALNDLAFHYINAGSWKEAMPLLQEVLSQGPGDDIPWINMANVLFHLGDYDQALRSINNAFSAKRVGERPPSAEEWLIKVAILRALSRAPEPSISTETVSSASEPSSSSDASAPSSSTSSATVTTEPTTKATKSDFQGDIITCFVSALKAVDKTEVAQAHFEYADYLAEQGQVDQARAKLTLALKIKPAATVEQLNLTRLDLQPTTLSLFEELKRK